MRTEILDRLCNELERNAPPILERCDQSALLQHARRIYLAGGAPLSQEDLSKPDLIKKIVHAAERFLVHAIEQGMLWIGDFEEEKARIQAAAEQEYEGWMARFQVWADGSA